MKTTSGQDALTTRISSVPDREFERPETVNDIMELAYLGTHIVYKAMLHIGFEDDATWQILRQAQLETNEAHTFICNVKFVGFAEHNCQKRCGVMPSTGNILDVAPQGEKELSNGSIRSDIPFPGSSERSEGLRLCDQRIIGNQQSLPKIQGAGEKHNQLHLSRQAGCVLDVANQGRGIAPSTESITVGIGGEATAIASPLYLLASEIVDVVEFAAQYRAEEEAAAEEGALIDASGYQRPEFERNGR